MNRLKKMVMRMMTQPSMPESRQMQSDLNRTFISIPQMKICGGGHALDLSVASS
jgi:hypothetical protein